MRSITYVISLFLLTSLALASTPIPEYEDLARETGGAVFYFDKNTVAKEGYGKNNATLLEMTKEATLPLLWQISGVQAESPVRYQFAIDSSVTFFSILATGVSKRPNIILKNPRQQSITPQIISAGLNGDFYIVKAPEPGIWEIEAIADTSLSLQIKIDSQIFCTSNQVKWAYGHEGPDYFPDKSPLLPGKTQYFRIEFDAPLNLKKINVYLINLQGKSVSKGTIKNKFTSSYQTNNPLLTTYQVYTSFILPNESFRIMIEAITDKNEIIQRMEEEIYPVK